MPRTKFSLAQRAAQSASTSTAKAVANSTPLIHAFAEKIMGFYTPSNTELSEDEQMIQHVFNKFPSDEITNRLALIMGLLTGYTPDTKNTSTPTIGTLFKQNGNIFVTVAVIGGHAYGINANCNLYGTLLQGTKITEGSQYFVTRAEAGLFCKDLLKVSGTTLLTYLSNTIAGSIAQLIPALGTEVV